MGIVPVPGKEALREAEKGAMSFLGLVQRLLRLAQEQQKHAGLIETQAAEIKAQGAEIALLREAVSALRAREEIVMLKAEAAATRSASGSMADLARRIGHLEAGRRDDTGTPPRR
jgi:hypothetical protein